jgi:hypothetical protein
MEDSWLLFCGCIFEFDSEFTVYGSVFIIPIPIH